MNDIQYYKSFCSGCGLCHSVDATTLCVNEKGFLEPDISKTDFQKKYCPISKENCNHLCQSDDIWGDYISVKRGYSTDKSLRKIASSGGILSEIAAYLVEQHIVDGIIHIGASGVYSSKVFCSVSREEIIAHAGSRYIQTSPLNGITQMIEKDKKYAFIGKPCDVTILRNYLDKKRIKNIHYFLSFFCAGMPSLNANQDLVKRMSCVSDVKELHYRGNGWPGYARVIGHDGKEYTMTYENAWGGILGRDKHKLCRLCMDGIGLCADIVCADAWYIRNGKPDFSEHDGRNLIICRSVKGNRLIEKIEKSGRIKIKNYDTFNVEMPIIQKYQYDRRATMAYQVLALKLCGKKTPKYTRHSLVKYKKYSDFKSRIDIFWGTLKRVYRGRYK